MKSQTILHAKNSDLFDLLEKFSPKKDFDLFVHCFGLKRNPAQATEHTIGAAMDFMDKLRERDACKVENEAIEQLLTIERDFTLYRFGCDDKKELTSLLLKLCSRHRASMTVFNYLENHLIRRA